MLMGMILWALSSIPVTDNAPVARDATDMRHNIVCATGIGRARKGLSGAQARLMAERAAQVVACRNLLVKLQREAGVGPGEGGSAIIRGTIAGHHYLPTRFLADGTAVVTVVLNVSPSPSPLPEGVRSIVYADGDR